MNQNEGNNINVVPVYKYYAEMVCTEHFPTAKEVAEYAGIYTTGHNPYSSFVIAYMNSVSNDKIYYFGKNGKTRVINDYRIIVQMLILINQTLMTKKTSESKVPIVIKIGTRNYHLIVEKVKVNNALKTAFKAST